MIILTSPLTAEEKNTFYLKKVNGKFGWFKNGDEKKHWKFTGEIKNGRPNGKGVLSRNSIVYSGEVKNGLPNGKGTYTFKNGKKRVGEFKKGKPWNVSGYDKEGNIINEWINGKKIVKKTDNFSKLDPNKKTGTLYLKKVDGKVGWFKIGDSKNILKYTGEIDGGKPNGYGELSSPSSIYSGEFKNGFMHGQITHSYKNGKKRVGEFRKGKPWNVIAYDKNRNVESQWVKGKKLKKEEIIINDDEGSQEKFSFVKYLDDLEIGFRLILGSGPTGIFTGNTSSDSTTTNSSFSLTTKNYGVGVNQMTFDKTSSSGQVFEMNNSSLDISYTLDLTYILDMSATVGFGYIYEGDGSYTSTNGISYETESVSGIGLFGFLGTEWKGISALIGLRYFSIYHVDFLSTVNSDNLGIMYTIDSHQIIYGLEYNF